MSYPWFIATRYLLAKRKQAIIYVISIISVLGIVVGVAALVVVLALMTGFQEEIQGKILGGNAHLTIRGGWSGRTVENVGETMARLDALDAIAATAPAVYERGMVTSQLNPAGTAILIKGIDTRADPRVTAIATQVRGDLRTLAEPGPGGRDRAILGKDLALSLGVAVGDPIRVIIAQANVSPFLTVPRSREFEVAGISDAGFQEYDSSRIYVSIDAARRFVGLSPGEATVIEARVSDPRRLESAARRVQEALGDGYHVDDLIRMNSTFFSALRLEKLAMSIAIGLIVLVAALNIVSILILMVMEKVKDIGVLAAMGATAGGVQRVFLLQGLILSVLGTASGVILGVSLSWALDRYRLLALPADIYFIPYVPFHVQATDVLLVALLTIAVSFLATLYPSWRAAQLDPSEALRYE